MLRRYEQIKFSVYNSLYDIVVTKDNFLRKVKELLEKTKLSEIQSTTDEEAKKGYKQSSKLQWGL